MDFDILRNTIFCILMYVFDSFLIEYNPITTESKDNSTKHSLNSDIAISHGQIALKSKMVWDFDY